jgi:hypothetical protein
MEPIVFLQIVLENLRDTRGTWPGVQSALYYVLFGGGWAQGWVLAVGLVAWFTFVRSCLMIRRKDVV